MCRSEYIRHTRFGGFGIVVRQTRRVALLKQSRCQKRIGDDFRLTCEETAPGGGPKIALTLALQKFQAIDTCLHFAQRHWPRGFARHAKQASLSDPDASGKTKVTGVYQRQLETVFLVPASNQVTFATLMRVVLDPAVVSTHPE